MGKNLISNDSILKMFQEIDAVRSDEALSELQITERAKKIRDGIVITLSFLVYGQAKQYRNFPNYEDLVQEGFIGLVKAVQKFDWSLYSNFFAYAEQWIRHSIKRAASRFDIVYNPNKTRVIYAESSESEIDEGDNPDRILFETERKTNIKKILGEFPEREREVVNKIFGLEGSAPETLREIGPQFDLTYERIRQIKNNVIGKLKKHQGMIEMS